MLIQTEAVGPIFKNGFIVACDRTGEAVFIDPGDEVGTLLAFAEGRKLSIRYILLTHAHIDHVTGVPEAKRRLNVPIYLHRDDLFLYEGAVEQARIFGLKMEPPPPIDHFYEKGDVIRFGDLEARAHATRRATVRAASVCRSARWGRPGVDLFVGDTLFAGVR